MVVSPCKQPVVEGILGKLGIYSISLIRISISLAYQAGSWKGGEKEREKHNRNPSFFFFPPSTMRSIENEKLDTQTGRSYITFVCISWWEEWFIRIFVCIGVIVERKGIKKVRFLIISRGLYSCTILLATLAKQILATERSESYSICIYSRIYNNQIGY